ncbi:MAG: YggU family protein [Anaerolinea sp.]|nr:YggU family protein [Anaerolinea sp.]
MAVDLDKTVLKVKLIPRSSRNEVVGFMDDGTLKIKLTAPPVEGQANQAVIKFLAGILNIPTGNIEILSGKTSHNKLISILGIKQESVNLLLQNQIVK